MAIEHPESYGWWINELESLGVTDAKRFDELDNDKAESKDIAENAKEMMLQHTKLRMAGRCIIIMFKRK